MGIKVTKKVLLRFRNYLRFEVWELPEILGIKVKALSRSRDYLILGD